MGIGIVGAIQAFFQLFPVILEMIKMIQDTPEEKRAKKLEEIHNAVKHAHNKKGDTSRIEDIIKG